MTAKMEALMCFKLLMLQMVGTVTYLIYLFNTRSWLNLILPYLEVWYVLDVSRKGKGSIRKFKKIQTRGYNSMMRLWQELLLLLNPASFSVCLWGLKKHVSFEKR